MGSVERIPAVGFKVPEDQSLRKSIQRLRWFKSTFEEQVQAVSTRSGITFQTNAHILTACFLDWIRGFEAAKPLNSGHRLAYVGFTAGKMLKEMIVKKPLSVVEMSKAADPELPEYFWPEGYVYVAYCLNIRRSVLQQDFQIDVQESPSLEEIRTWWSFKENVTQSPDYAIAFLDMFAGEEPDWTTPGLFTAERRTEHLM